MPARFRQSFCSVNEVTYRVLKVNIYLCSEKNNVCRISRLHLKYNGSSNFSSIWNGLIYHKFVCMTVLKLIESFWSLSSKVSQYCLGYNLERFGSLHRGDAFQVLEKLYFEIRYNVQFLWLEVEITNGFNIEQHLNYFEWNHHFICFESVWFCFFDTRFGLILIFAMPFKKKYISIFCRVLLTSYFVC